MYAKFSGTIYKIEYSSMNSRTEQKGLLTFLLFQKCTWPAGIAELKLDDVLVMLIQCY